MENIKVQIWQDKKCAAAKERFRTSGGVFPLTVWQKFEK